MALQSLGTQHHLHRAGLEVEIKSSEAAPVLPTADSIPSGICRRPSGQEGRQTGEIHQLPGPTLLRAEERLGKEKSNPGPVSPEQIHPMRQVPDAHYCADTDPATPGGLRNLHRSYRRLLAYPNSAPLLPLPWLCSRPQGLCIQDYALRAKYCSKGFHQADRDSTPASSEAGSTSGCLPRRLAHMGPDVRTLPTGGPQGHIFPAISGLPDKLQEVQPGPSAVIHLARPPLGPVSAPAIPTSCEKKGDCPGSKGAGEKESHLEETSGESHGISPVRLSGRSDPEGPTQRHESGLAETCQSLSERQTVVHTPTALQAAQTVDQNQKPVALYPSAASPSHSYDSHGCIPSRVGRPYPDQVGAGALVRPIPVVSHKHPRSDGSVSDIEENQSETGLSYTSHAGQQYNRSLHKSERFQISSDQSCDLGHPLSGKEKELAPKRSSHRGGPKCTGRRLVKDSPSGVGVDVGQTVLPVHSDPGTDLADRSVRNVGQPSAPTVCRPERRPSCSRDGRLVLGLEQVAEHLPLPPCETSVQSPPQAEVLQGDSGHCSSFVAKEQLVSASHRTPAQTGPAPTADTQSDSTSEACLRFIMADGEASFDDFLVLAMGRRKEMSEDNVRFSEMYKTLSTHRQYQSWWKKWVAYVRSKKPEVISLDFCVSFLRSLHEDGLASSTITSLKSGISVPIRYAFNVDLSEEVFQKTVKACARLRPKQPKRPPSWSLAKVLEKAASISLDCKDLTLQLRKTAFLLSLASGGRISEITALMRGEEYIQFLPSGEAKLAPDRAFLAKNESPSARWEPWRIPPLPDFPLLCPVRALQHYLHLTKSLKEGQLFRGETCGSKLSAKQLGNKIIAFICSAEPDKQARVHELRGIGASLNFYEYMCFEDLKGYTGWKSPRVFFKHYLKAIESLSVPVVAAGKVIHPR